jgi:PKD repeat protein
MRVRKAVNCKWLLFFILLLQGFISNGQLAAKFSATPLAGCAPLLVNFTDQSTGNPTSWKWDLGNGTISYLQNPAVTYFAPGQYNVKLIATNASGDNEIIKSQYITVYAVPVVNFGGTPTNGCFPLPVQFTDQSNAGSGSITKWEWDFGDGNLSSTPNPLHTYLSAGNFNISLRATNTYGCITTITKQQYIQVSNGAKADFTTSTPSSCTVPHTVNFTNTSTGTGTLTYKWDFGDGTISSLINPTHTYTAAGNYTVRLIVSNTAGCTDTISKSNIISVGNVKANFSVPAGVCEGTPFTITNTSSPAPANVTWDFGDGTFSNVISPTKIYNATGNFIIKLVAGFGSCADSLSLPISITTKPVITFTADKTASCIAPLTVNFNSVVNGGNLYYWDFGDGTTSTQQNPTHTYTYYGVFNVMLVVTNSSGCKDSLLKSSYIQIQKPVVSIPGLPVKGCAPLTFQFKADINTTEPITSYLWNFGDGTTSTLANPAHTFTNGNYTISVIIITVSGCTDSVTVVNGITAGNKLKINFTADPRDVCAKLPIQFTDLSTGGTADKWLWYFGDGTTSSDQHPKHPYNDTGYFDVKLVVWNNGCADSITFKDYIHISPPIAIFGVTLNCSLKNQRTFTDFSIGADTWSWDFGDGTSSTLQNPPIHSFPDTGTYKVVLTVTNLKTGCSHSQSQTVVIVNEKADFTASDTSICKGSTINFSTKNINSANISSFYWKFGDGIEGTYNSPVQHVYAKAGRYTVTLVITDKFNCKDTIEKNLYIRVTSPAAYFVNSAPGICLNNAITFIDSSLADFYPIQKWIWNFGDSTTKTFTSPPFQHTYGKPGVYSVKLTVIDSKGCRDSLEKINSLIISKPVANFISADTLSCQSQIISFTNLSTGPNLTYRWSLGDGTISTSVNPTHQYLSEGVYTVKLYIADA